MTAIKRRGRPPKPRPSNEPTIGEALEDVRDALRSFRRTLFEVDLRMDKLREIIERDKDK